MFLRKANSKWIVRTPAKLNVYLAILGRRADGFHELQTLMVPISLYDGLTFEPDAPQCTAKHPLSLDVRSIPPHPSATAGCLESEAVAKVPADESNLVMRALAELRRQSGRDCRARVELLKRIPAGAGLGGGSSDAAAALLVANAAWRLGLGTECLMEIAASLGSDVPFFLTGRTAVCSGRGERVLPVQHSTRLHFVVVTPAVRVASADVYAKLNAPRFQAAQSDNSSRFRHLVASFQQGDTGHLRRLLFNGLERGAFALAPSLKSFKEWMQRVAKTKVIMSGSGSSFFCVCNSSRQARLVGARLRSAGLAPVVAAASSG